MFSSTSGLHCFYFILFFSFKFNYNYVIEFCLLDSIVYGMWCNQMVKGQRKRDIDYFEGVVTSKILKDVIGLIIIQHNLYSLGFTLK